MAMSDYLENLVLENVLNNGANPASTSVYVALATTPTDDAGGGTEVSGGSYARVIRTGGFTVSGVATRAGNTAIIPFPTATADWGTVTHVKIFDALVAGNLLFHGALTTPRLVENGDTFSISIDTLGITLA